VGRGAVSTKELPRGSRVGPYTIIRRVPGGIGGMATVYEARLDNKGPSVALKIAHEGLGGFLKDEIAFLKAAKIEHPNIIKILPTPIGGGSSDYVVRDPVTGCWYFAMEFLSGGSLDDWLQRKKRLTLQQGVEIVRQVGAALDAAHRAGIVHLDVKPSNILFREPPGKNRLHAVLTDFGIARPQSRVTISGEARLTVEYASPEQVQLAQGEEIDIGPASDLYSLAVILYEAIGGRLPFNADNDLAMMNQIVYELPPLPIPSAPPQLTPILQRALAKDPEARYPSAQALVADLEALLREAYGASSGHRRQMHIVLALLSGVVMGLGMGVPAGHYLTRTTEVTPLPPEVIVVTATPTRAQGLLPTITPSVTPTLRATASTREPTSTPVPPTSTSVPRPPVGVMQTPLVTSVPRP